MHEDLERIVVSIYGEESKMKQFLVDQGLYEVESVALTCTEERER